MHGTAAYCEADGDRDRAIANAAAAMDAVV